MEKNKRIVVFCSFSFVLCSVFLMNIRSWFIWQIIPLGDYIQFPWRLLMITTLFSCLMVGFIGDIPKIKWIKYAPLLLAVASIFFTWNYFKPSGQFFPDDDYYLRRFFADRISVGKSNTFSQEYLNYSEDYLPLTAWTKKRPDFLPPKIETNDRLAKAIVDEQSPTNYKVSSNSNKEISLTFNSYYFPGWLAKIDGKETKIKILEPYGNMGVIVPAGEHKIFFSSSRLRCGNLPT